MGGEKKYLMSNQAEAILTATAKDGRKGRFGGGRGKPQEGGVSKTQKSSTKMVVKETGPQGRGKKNFSPQGQTL